MRVNTLQAVAFAALALAGLGKQAVADEIYYSRILRPMLRHRYASIISRSFINRSCINPSSISRSLCIVHDRWLFFISHCMSCRHTLRYGRRYFRIRGWRVTDTRKS